MRPPIAIALAAAAALAGCGGGGDDPLEGFSGRERGVVATVLAYNTAARNRDGRTVCREILSREAKAPLGQECVRRVTAALRSIDQQGIDVVAVRFKQDDTAIATVVTGAGRNPRSGTLALVQEGGLWRIARVGPLPPPGADTGRPR